MRIVRRLLSMFTGGGRRGTTRGRSRRGRSGGGGLMSIVSRFLGGGRRGRRRF